MDDEPPEPRRKRPKKSGSSLALLWVVLGGAGILAVVAVAVVVVIVMRTRTREPQRAPTREQLAALGQQRSEPTAATTLRELKAATVLAYSHDGKYLATGGPIAPGEKQQLIRVWDLAGDRSIAQFDWKHSYVAQLAFSPDGKVLAAGGDGDAVMWDLDTKKQRYRDTMEDEYLFRGGDRLLNFSPDGKWLVTTAENQVIVTEVANGVINRTPYAQNRSSHSAASPTDTVIAIGKIEGNRPVVASVTLYNYVTKDRIRSPEFKFWASALAYSRDGKTIALSTSDGPVYFYDVQTWKLKATLNQARNADNSFLYYEKIALSPDGGLFAGVPMKQGRPTAEMWPLGGKEIRPLNPDWASTLAFSPDGKTIALATYQAGVKFLDPETGQEKKP